MYTHTIMVAVFFIGIPWILFSMMKVVLSHIRQMRLLKLKADTAAKLLDRFGSEPALLDFLRTEARHGLFEVKLQETGLSGAHARALTSVQIAAFLMAGGIGFLVYKLYLPGHRGDAYLALFFGSMGLALGAGALISAVAAVVAAERWQRHERDEARS